MIARCCPHSVDRGCGRCGGAGRRPAVRGRACGRRPRAAAPAVTLRPMTIEVPPAALYALADALRAQGEEADEVAVRLAGPSAVPGRLGAAVEAFLEAHRTAAAAVAGSCAGWAPRSPPSRTPGSGST